MAAQYSGIMVTETSTVDGVEVNRSYFKKKKPHKGEVGGEGIKVKMQDTRNMDWCPECKQLRHGTWQKDGEELIRICEKCGAEVDYWGEL